MIVELNRAQIDDRLRDAGTGVLALADSGDAYAIPESFGYDGEHLYFQFVFDDDSRKMSYVETTAMATHVVYTTDPTASVVVIGALERVREDDRASAAAAIGDNAEIPAVNVSPTKESDALTYEFYRLTPTEISGRKFEAAQSVVP